MPHASPDVLTSSTPRIANFVIGGTEKAGTTSTFDWLSVHPEVLASSVKETNFFIDGYAGDPSADARRYAQHFRPTARTTTVRMEASPAYLGAASLVAPRMRRLAPGVKTAFILREPVARLHSCYQFFRAKLWLPQELDFDGYVERCLAYERGLQTPQSLGLGEWFLQALRHGCYAEGIARFGDELGSASVKVCFFEDLCRDERAFMQDLSGYLQIDASFWSDFEFRRSNVTYSGRLHGLHRVANAANVALEPFLRHHPVLKRRLVRAYKALNQRSEGYGPMPSTTRERLTDFYAPSVDRLRRLLGRELPRGWERVDAKKEAGQARLE